MFLEESFWIKEKLRLINLPPAAKVLDIGSSSIYFRTKEQPYIEENVFKPLRDKGCQVIHLDTKKEQGVDLVCSIDLLFVIRCLI